MIPWDACEKEYVSKKKNIAQCAKAPGKTIISCFFCCFFFIIVFIKRPSSSRRNPFSASDRTLWHQINVSAPYLLCFLLIMPPATEKNDGRSVESQNVSVVVQDLDVDNQLEYNYQLMVEWDLTCSFFTWTIPLVCRVDTKQHILLAFVRCRRSFWNAKKAFSFCK